MIQNNPQIQSVGVAFVTAKNDAKSILKAGELGADFYVMKPIQSADFSSRIAAFFRKKPARESPKVIFERNCMAETRVFRDVEIVSISELGLEIRMQEEPDQVMEISSSALREIPFSQPLMRVLSCHGDAHGSYKVMLGFAEIQPETSREIRNWISQKKLRRQISLI